jgi:hypothetical protein
MCSAGWAPSEDQILEEHPDLEKADFPDVYRFAADAGRSARLR